MMKFLTRLNLNAMILACLLVPMSAAFVGCDSNDGAAEKAGEKLDEAGEEIKDEADDAT